MLSTNTLKELDMTIALEFATPAELDEEETEETDESAEDDGEESLAPAWEELYDPAALTLVADGRKSSDDEDEGGDLEFDEFDDDLEEDDAFEDEEFEEGDDVDAEFDDLDVDEEAEEEEDL